MATGFYGTSGVSNTTLDDAIAAAQAAEANAQTSETNAANSAAAASTSETNASSSASAASSSASAASTSASNAANSETNASTSASNAGTSETNAAASAASAAAEVTNAQAEVTYAEEWANKAEDSLVSVAAGGNGVDEYSAKHHAAKAAASLSGKLDLTGGTMTGNLTLDEVTETVHTMTGVDIDPVNGTWQKRTLAGNETFTFSNFATGQAVFVTVVPGANTLTLSNVNEWVGGSAPVTIEAEHAFVFWSDDGGVTITGNSIGGIS